jgi:3-deoxy-D-arabino-heptulosonate 7-phosphate (DAHP) synthase
MNDKSLEKFYDDILCKDVRSLTEILATISSSYRLLVGAADELNKIALVHRHEAEEAIERADDLGEIIDDVQDELKILMKLYLQELKCKIDYQVLCNCKSLRIGDLNLISQDFLNDVEKK